MIITLNLDSILDFAQIKYLRIYFEIIFISLVGTFFMYWHVQKDFNDKKYN